MKKLVVIFLFGILFSCNPGKDPVDKTAEVEAFKNERNNFFLTMNTAQNTAAELQATGAEFNATLINDPSLYLRYAGDSLKSAANLGVYLSDLNYCVAYKESDEIKELFNSSIVLSRELGIDGKVLEFLMDRYLDNLFEHDSVADVVDELYEKSTTQFREESHDQLLGVAMAAYQIETLHLALGTIETYPKDTLPDDSLTHNLVPLYKFVLEQQESIETIHTFLGTLGNTSEADESNYAYYDQAFKELIAVYQRLDIDEAIANNRGAELLNNDVLIELSEKVDAIRSKIVSTED
jgi:hypothetical protein